MSIPKIHSAICCGCSGSIPEFELAANGGICWSCSSRGLALSKQAEMVTFRLTSLTREIIDLINKAGFSLYRISFDNDYVELIVEGPRQGISKLALIPGILDC